MTKYQAGGPRRPYEITLLVVAVAAAGLQPAYRDHQLAAALPRHADPAAPVVGHAVPARGHAGNLLRRGLRLRRLAEPAVRRGNDPAGRADPAHRGPAAARRGARGHAVPRHGAGRERHRRPQRAAVQHGQTALAGTCRAAHRHLPDRPVRRRDPVLAAQRPAVPPARVVRCGSRSACGRPRPRWPCCCGCPSSGTARRVAGPRRTAPARARPPRGPVSRYTGTC